MLEIYKISAHTTIDYAAEELRKYLRMMMPNVGEVNIYYDENAFHGYRLGLMQDFGLDVSDAENVELDDIIYIETDCVGGIIAGSNPRSVLLAVYEFLRQNGCRWLFPGVDGEIIPDKAVEEISYRHKASCRYRGPCIEGAESQQILLDTIDFLPKVGMNLFMMQFFVPDAFYERYYEHTGSTVKKAEPITTETVIKWKAQCEAEMSKRSIQFHDVGHAWTADPLGIPSVNLPKNPEDTEKLISPESREFIAMLNGERKLYRSSPLCTNFCMSNTVARKRIADYLTDYAKKHSNVDYLHVWLADFSNNHCECESCREKTPSDWYMVLMNDIDEALTKAQLDTRIVFIAYVDTMWAPLSEMVKNTDRFSLMMAPISRSYDKTLDPSRTVTLQPYERNKLRRLESLDEYIAHLGEWRKVWHGPNFSFEYYFWTTHLWDASGIELAKRIYEDIHEYKKHGIDGIIGCGTQRCYFPNGFAYYLFARSMFDTSLSYSQILNEYYSLAYGKGYEDIISYEEKLSELMGFNYLGRRESEDMDKSFYYSPARAEKIMQMGALLDEGESLIEKYEHHDTRVNSVSFKLLKIQVKYLRLLSDVLYAKAQGRTKEAIEKFDILKDEMSKIENDFEKYLDLWLITHTFGSIVTQVFNIQDLEF